MWLWIQCNWTVWWVCNLHKHFSVQLETFILSFCSYWTHRRASNSGKRSFVFPSALQFLFDHQPSKQTNTSTHYSSLWPERGLLWVWVGHDWRAPHRTGNFTMLPHKLMKNNNSAFLLVVLKVLTLKILFNFFVWVLKIKFFFFF